MIRTFTEKLEQVQQGRDTLALYISPRLDRMPPEFQRHDDPFLPYMRSIYAATANLICVYIFDFAAYLAIGAAGVIALERSIALAEETHITVLDARFSTGDYAQVWDEAAFNYDAVTVTPDAPSAAFGKRPDRQAFVITASDKYPARYDRDNGLIVLGQNTLTVLPLDTLDHARSLSFEDTLRTAVDAYAHV